MWDYLFDQNPNKDEMKGGGDEGGGWMRYEMVKGMNEIGEERR